MYLRILKADIVKQLEMKENITKKLWKRTKKLLKTRICRRNLIKGKNSWAVVYKILGIILKMDLVGTQVNRSKGNRTHNEAQGFKSR